MEGLVHWIQQQDFDTVIATDALSTHYPAATAFTKNASGLLAVKLSRVEPQYVLWFRPEVITTVTWAGNPYKPTTDKLALHPRKSFATWKQQVTGRSLPGLLRRRTVQRNCEPPSMPCSYAALRI